MTTPLIVRLTSRIIILAAAPIVVLRLGGGHGIPFVGFEHQFRFEGREGVETTDEGFEAVDVGLGGDGVDVLLFLLSFGILRRLGLGWWYVGG